MSSLPKSRPVIKKTYLKLKTEEGISQEFQKAAYWLHPERNGKVLLHYLENEEIAKPISHGNSQKQSKLYFRTKPSKLQDLKEKVEKQNAHVVYKEEIVKGRILG